MPNDNEKPLLPDLDRVIKTLAKQGIHAWDCPEDTTRPPGTFVSDVYWYPQPQNCTCWVHNN